MKELHYNVTGQDRKELVGIISKVVGMKAVYKFMPTCAFVISNITVEKDGTIPLNLPSSLQMIATSSSKGIYSSMSP